MPNSILTITLVGNLDLQLLLWNLKDVELLRTRYRMVCNFIGCLASNPLQNQDNSLPAVLSFEQLLLLLNLDDIDSKKLRPVNIQLELFSQIKNNNLMSMSEFQKIYKKLPKAPPALLVPLNRLASSSRYLVYQYLYLSPQKFFITSGSKFGGDYLLYYDDPDKCHSQHIVNTFEPNQLFNLNQLVSYGRLASGVNKTRILATVRKENESNKCYVLAFILTNHCLVCICWALFWLHKLFLKDVIFMFQLLIPFRFGQIEEGVYRGAYPKPRNYAFLKRLKLKSILSLIPEQPNPSLATFCKQEDINNLWIRVSKPKENVPLSYSKIIRCLQVIINPDNLPMYIHCLDGTIVTGIVLACLRKLQMWSVTSCLQDYLRYSGEEVITTEESEFVRSFKSPIEIKLPIPNWLWPTVTQPLNQLNHPTIPCKILDVDSTIPIPELKQEDKEQHNFNNNTKDNDLDNKIESEHLNEALTNLEINESDGDLSRMVQALALEGMNN